MKIQYLNGENAGSFRTVGADGIGIGRETDNGIQLLVGGVSRYHARLELRPGGWFLLDLGSTNGTRLNGNLISGPAALKDGDVFGVGDQLFRVDDPSSAEKKSPEPPPEPKPEQPAFVFRPPQAQENLPSPEPKAAEPAGDPEPSMTKPFFDNPFEKKTEDNAPVETQVPNPKKRIINLLFLLLVLIVAGLVLVLFVSIQRPRKIDPSGENTTAVRTCPNPFFVYYMKRMVTKNNQLFSFRLLLENGHLSLALDDLQSGRVYSPDLQDPIRPEALEKLKAAIDNTKFMSSVQQEKISDAAENTWNYSRLVIGYDDKFNDISVQNSFPWSFIDAENAIQDFLMEELGLDSSMTKSRDELIQEANRIYALADKQFNNYKAQPDNLWRAIENFRIALRQYEVFQNKPAEWELARTHLAEAEEIQKTILKEGHAKVNLYYQQREFDRAVEECARLMEFFPPDSTKYQRIREQKIKLESIMKKKD